MTSNTANLTAVPTSPLRLVRRASVESESFEDFYRRSWSNAVKLAGIMTQDSSVAEEIAQESFERMMLKWPTMRQPAGYLRVCIVNASRQYHRHNGVVRGKLGWLVTTEQADDPISELADAVAKLPFRQRAVLVLRYYGDLSEREIAEALGCRSGTVKSLSSRALAALSKEIIR